MIMIAVAGGIDMIFQKSLPHIEKGTLIEAWNVRKDGTEMDHYIRRFGRFSKDHPKGRNIFTHDLECRCEYFSHYKLINPDEIDPEAYK